MRSETFKRFLENKKKKVIEASNRAFVLSYRHRLATNWKKVGQSLSLISRLNIRIDRCIVDPSSTLSLPPGNRNSTH